MSDSTDATIDSADWSTAITWSSAGTTNLSASSAALRRSFQVSDWIFKSSITNTLSQYPLLGIRIFVAANANPITIMGNGSDNFSNWASHPSGRIWKMRRANGNFASTSQSSFTASASTSNQCPVIGVQYAARGKIITVMGVGDSLTEGRGTYIGEGYIFPAVTNVSNKNRVPIEYCNLGWSGASSGAFRNSAIDVLSAGIIPDIMVVPNGSPNDISTTITAANINSLRINMNRILAECRDKNVQTLITTWMPSNPAIKDYGGSDSLRTTYNAETLLYRNTGSIVVDTSSVLSGITDGDGQVNMLAGSTTDNIHPNDFGNSLLTALLTSYITDFSSASI